MKLYLLRHAHAVDAVEDLRRPLSRKGRGQVAQLARFFRRNGVLKPDEIWHSPLERSRETAALLTRKLKWPDRMREIAGLEPGDPPREVVKQVAAFAGNLAIVGHEPHLSALATLLLRGRTAPSLIRMKKGACLALNRSEDGWQVCWLVTPKLLPD